MTKICWHGIRCIQLLTIVLLLTATTLTPALAQNESTLHQADTVAVTHTKEALTIVWPNPAVATASAATLLEQLPTVRFQGYLLPMQLLTVALDDKQPLALELGDVRSQPWEQNLEPAPALAPTAIDWESMADPTQPAELVELPTAPVFVLRKGLLHNQMIAVVAVSPLYREGGVTKVATTVTARMPHARAVTPQELTATPQAVIRQRQAAADTALGPVNPDAFRNGYKVMVATAGMQQITGQQLANLGFDLNTDPTRLRLHHQGTEIALQIEGLVNGSLATSSVLRFYAAQVGDRWNAQETYWLTIGEGVGLRMPIRSVAQGTTAPIRTTAFEVGTWSTPLLYDSRYAGSDQDHWFHQKLVASQSTASAENSAALATLAPRLPRIADTATYTIAVTTNMRGNHAMRVQNGNTQQDITWNSVITTELILNWQHEVNTADPSNLLTVALLSSDQSNSESTFLLDKIDWRVPVALNFNGVGATFQGVAGDWRYHWSNLPAGYTLYDVTTPQMPLVLAGADTTGFQDGPTARSYVLASPATFQTPSVATYHQMALTDLRGADAVYIGPAQFLGGLEPLLQLRREQGYQVVTVDVQQLYDGWNFGQVDPEAIRTFLRYAAATWQPAPRSVVLVGDGTVDPRNYEEKGNTNFIPPYLAKVDPWLIEAACEPCYGQLDGDNPVTGDDPEGHFFSTELWIGRLPVKSVSEVASLVAKIVSYERATSIQGWQNISLFVADNYIKGVNNDGTPVRDLAGDFAKISDGLLDLSPANIRAQRIYYDPYPQFSDPARSQPWRIEDAQQARNTVLSRLSSGAGIVTYNGHSHHWQWAITDESPNADQNWLLGLYDTDTLSNNNRYFVSLSMTCLTSQFQKPAFSGTVLDERMLLNPTGGAVAVWGPSGLSVAYGHDLLQRGFYSALWAAPPLTAKMGELIEAGNIALLTQGACCQDTLKTFLLLGDPLTTVRVYNAPLAEFYLPVIRR
ncbi:MAG: hypothetical protein KF832_24735 [Caldilineaceae bacterium]|nr:hypothetical protein [Caldilineaceae bacterium]